MTVDKVWHLEREHFEEKDRKSCRHREDVKECFYSVLVLLIDLFVVADSLRSTNPLSWLGVFLLFCTVHAQHGTH